MRPSFAVVPSDAMIGSGHGSAAQARPSLLPLWVTIVDRGRRNDTGTALPLIPHLRTCSDVADRLTLHARNGPEQMQQGKDSITSLGKPRGGADRAW